MQGKISYSGHPPTGRRSRLEESRGIAVKIKAPRVRRLTEDPEDLNARAEREHKLWQMGFVPTLETINETYPGEFEPLVVAAPDPAPLPQTGGGAGGEVTLKFLLL